jgi:hypothetical protein
LANLRLRFVHAFKDRHGTWRHYFRRLGLKVIALPGLPGSAEFMRAYEAALGGESAQRVAIGASRSKPGSVAAAVALYFQSIAFGNLNASSRRVRRRILERFREENRNAARRATLPQCQAGAMMIRRLASAISKVAKARAFTLGAKLRSHNSRPAIRSDHAPACVRVALVHGATARRYNPHGTPAYPGRVPSSSPAKNRRDLGNGQMSMSFDIAVPFVFPPSLAYIRSGLDDDLERLSVLCLPEGVIRDQDLVTAWPRHA